jgi:hypothetical protein
MVKAQLAVILILLTIFVSSFPDKSESIDRLRQLKVAESNLEEELKKKDSV